MSHEGVIQRQIADLDDRREVAGWLGRSRGPGGPRGARDGAGTVFGQDQHLMAAGQLGMLGDEGAPMLDAEHPGAPLDLHRLTDQREGDGVAVGVDADQPVVGDDAVQRGSSRKLGWLPVGTSVAASRPKRSSGRS